MNLIPVPRADHPASWEDFHQRIISKRKPVVMRAGDYVARAIERWGYDDLVERAGDAVVDVEVSRPDAVKPEDFMATTVPLTVRDLVNRLRSPVTDKVHYYAERNLFFDLPDLADDVDPLPFVPGPLVEKMTAFIGGPPAYTAAHLHGISEAAIIQIRGKKRMWLWDERDAPYLYPSDLVAYGNFSTIDFRQRRPVDLQAYPDYARVGSVYEVVLEPGDMMFIPTLCYHNAWAETQESISLTTFWLNDPSVYRGGKPYLEALVRLMAKQPDRLLKPGTERYFEECYRSLQTPAAQRVFEKLGTAR